MVSQLAEQHVAAGQQSRSEDFHVHLPSQPVHSFMRAEELWLSAARWVDVGALWEATEEGEQEPRHSSDCMPKPQASQSART